jgi:hypothetical protein
LISRRSEGRFYISFGCQQAAQKQGKERISRKRWAAARHKYGTVGKRGTGADIKKGVTITRNALI